MLVHYAWIVYNHSYNHIYIYIKDLDAFMFTGLTVHGIFMTLEGCSGHAVG